MQIGDVYRVPGGLVLLTMVIGPYGGEVAMALGLTDGFSGITDRRNLRARGAVLVGKKCSLASQRWRTRSVEVS